MNPKIVLLIKEYGTFRHKSGGIPFHQTSFLNLYSQAETTTVRIYLASEVFGISTVMIDMTYEVSDMPTVNSNMIFDIVSDFIANSSSLNSGVHRFISKNIHS